jgi:hypothetical protein
MFRPYQEPLVVSGFGWYIIVNVYSMHRLQKSQAKPPRYYSTLITPYACPKMRNITLNVSNTLRVQMPCAVVDFSGSCVISVLSFDTKAGTGGTGSAVWVLFPGVELGAELGGVN